MRQRTAAQLHIAGWRMGASVRRKEGFPFPSTRVRARHDDDPSRHVVDSRGRATTRASTHSAVRAHARRNPPRMTTDARHDAMQGEKYELPLQIAVRRMLFVNDSAGRRTDVPHCLSAFERHDISEASDVLAPLVGEGNLATRLLVAVWGGDGSMRTVAGLLIDTEATLLACPGGTHNHFSRALGVSDEEDVRAALENGEERLIDVGMAGSEVFLNNLSIGWYTDLVARRERYQRRVPRRLAKLASLLGQLLRTRRLRISVDETPERVWLVWVGNGEYSMSSTRLTDRESMESGVLDVRLLRAGARWPKLRAVVAVIKANAESSSHIVRRIAPSVALRGSRSRVRAALDGELIELPSPVLVTVRHRSLRVLIAPPTVDSEPSDG